jgi:hypothetical protein
MSNKLHPETLKMFNSPNYRKQVKRVVVAIKDLHNLKKIKRKGSSLVPDLSTVHYFSQGTEVGSDRRKQ